MLGIDPKAARFAWTFAVVLVLFALCFMIRKTLLVFAIAVMLAYLLYPFVDAIDRRLSRKRRTLAVMSPFLCIVVGLTAFFLITRQQIRNEVSQLALQVTNADFKNRLTQWAPFGLPVGKEILENYNLSQIQSQIVGFMPQLSRGVRIATRDLLNLVIIPILSFFILKDGPRIRDALIEILLESDRGTPLFFENRLTVQSILADAHTLILQYMRALLFLCLITLTCFAIALKVMGVKYAILLALVAFPLEFVPLVGPLIAAVIIVGVSEFNKYPHLAWIIAFLIAYRLFQDYILSPHLMKRGVQLHPLLVLFGVFAGGDIGGVGGLFLSIPILSLIRLAYYEWCKRRAKCRERLENPSIEAEPRGLTDLRIHMPSNS